MATDKERNDDQSVWQHLKRPVKWACIVIGGPIVVLTVLSYTLTTPAQRAGGAEWRAEIEAKVAPAREEPAAAEIDLPSQATALLEQIERGKAAREARTATAARKRRGFHCLSSRDGNHHGMERLVRGLLNNLTACKQSEPTLLRWTPASIGFGWSTLQGTPSASTCAAMYSD